MKPLGDISNDDRRDSVSLLMDAIPRTLCVLRAEVRKQCPAHLTVPQFRALTYLSLYVGASLSDLAEFIGITLPSASNLIDGLVEHNLVTRVMAVDDRRRAILNITEHGEAVLMQVREASAVVLARRMEILSDDERQTLSSAMRILLTMFRRSGG
jgi:DNA-binding MarR family transcriptional regulator